MNHARPSPSRDLPTIAVLAIIFTGVFLMHASLLRLPYFWDEAGYYIPAARDLLLTGSPIPHSTIDNSHPPLVMAWLALWWKLSGYTPAVTRTAMLLVSAFALTGVFRLARALANAPVALASTLLTALYPVWFAQSSLAQLDVAAAAFTMWALYFYVHDRIWLTALFFGIAGVAKETAIAAPLALIAWEVVSSSIWKRRLTPSQVVRTTAKSAENSRATELSRGNPFHTEIKNERSETNTQLATYNSQLKTVLALVMSSVPLAAWFAFHYVRTGVVFGNPDFVRYNVATTLNPLRIVLAMVERLWHALGYMNLFALTGAAALAMFSPALAGRERDRIAIPRQLAFAAVLVTYVLMLSILGGAVLARYMLPVIPLVIMVAVSTLRRRVTFWKWLIALAALAFVAALITNPPYRSAPEDNLNYADFVKLHKQAAAVISQRYAHSHVLTAWPASDELTKPYLGYVKQPVAVVRIDNFTVEQLELALQAREQYDVALLFSTKLEPSHPLLDSFSWWRRIHERFFDYHRDLPPEAAVRMLGGTIVWGVSRNGQWAAVVELPRDFNAKRFVTTGGPGAS